MNSAKRYRYEKWFWAAMTIPTLAYLGKTTMFVSLVSIYALFLGSAAAEASQEAKEAAERAQSDATEANDKRP